MNAISPRVRFFRDDITTYQAEVIVNPANVKARCGNGVDRAIFEAAGKKQLLQDRRHFKPIMSRGEVFVTDSYALKKNNVKYIFHTLSTFWMNGKFKEKEILRDCYWSCLMEAHNRHCKSIAFPILGTGSFGYPIKIAVSTAFETCWDYLDKHNDLEISLVVYQDEVLSFCRRYLEEIGANINDKDVQRGMSKEYLLKDESFSESIVIPENIVSHLLPREALTHGIRKVYISPEKLEQFEAKQPYEQVKDLINQYIDYDIRVLKIYKKKSEIYGAGDIRKSTFSDMCSYGNKSIPQLHSLLSLAIGLRLDKYSLEILLERAGYANEKSVMLQVTRDHIKADSYDLFQIKNEIYEKDPESPMVKEKPERHEIE